MREDLLHYIWKNQKFKDTTLLTSSNEVLEVVSTGQYNTSSGPDFFNGRVRIAGQEWAGNIEIHIKSSDWYAHGHEKDINYDNVVLHVVWVEDMEVFRKDGSAIPTLILDDYVGREVLTSYQDLVQGKKYAFVNCEKDVSEVDDLIWKQWQERLFVERLEQKARMVETLLDATKNDWETVLFMLLMKTFGLNKNGNAFLAIAQHLKGSLLRKVSKNALHLESLFFGLAGFLDGDSIGDEDHGQLKNTHQFLQNKFQILEYVGEKPVFFGLRPANFPTIRLSQLAAIYTKSPNLFGNLMEAKAIDDFFKLFRVAASTYWDTHYTFGKVSGKRKKIVTKEFVHLILINAVIPLRFCYGRYLGSDQIEGLIDLMIQLPSEKNTIIRGFDTIEVPSTSAFEGQAKIQLYHSYCKKNRCLQCSIGTDLLGRKN